MYDEKTYNEKLQRMETAMRNKTPDRVPVLCMSDNWALSYAGYTLEEITNDDEKHLKAYEKVLSDFPWDGAHYNVLTRAVKYIRALGGGTYKENTTLQVESGTVLCMEADEYDKLIENPYEFIINTIAERKYGLLQETDAEKKYSGYCSAMDEFFKYKKLGAEANRRAKEIHNVPMVRPMGFFHPLDLILDFMRDFSGTMNDIKRQPKKVAEACDVLLEMCFDNIVNFYPKHQTGCCIFNPMHIPEFLSPRDFGKVYWPSYKKIMDRLSELGYVTLSYYERNYEHLYDYLKELPVNTVGLFEDDDLRKTKKELSNMAIAGGMDCYTLYYGTKQNCIDMAKGLIDDLAPGGGYIFTTNRILHSPNDAKAENLLAVNEYVMENGNY